MSASLSRRGERGGCVISGLENVFELRFVCYKTCFLGFTFFISLLVFLLLTHFLNKFDTPPNKHALLGVIETICT